MSDPLTDPRAVDLLTAVPEDVSALAANFRNAAAESQRTSDGLRAAQHDGTWTGRAAVAFRRAIGRLPRELARVQNGFAGVAEALSAYESEVATIQPEFARVANELAAAQSHLGPAQQAAQQAATALRTGIHSGTLRGRALIEAELAVTHSDGALGDYNHEIIRLRRRASALLDEFQSARESCRNAVAAAQADAVTRPSSGYGTTVIDISGPIDGPGHAAPASPFTHAAVGNLPPGRARDQVTAMVKRANSLLGTPYFYGGGHGAWGSGGGLDCSGFVSSVLRAAGFLNAPQTTEGFASQSHIVSGPGRYVTIYDRTACGANEHVIIDINGQFYEAGGGSADGGAAYVHKFTPSHDYLASFNTVLHPTGL